MTLIEVAFNRPQPALVETLLVIRRRIKDVHIESAFIPNAPIEEGPCQFEETRLGEGN